jgi:hypothetical protein
VPKRENERRKKGGRRRMHRKYKEKIYYGRGRVRGNRGGRVRGRRSERENESKKNRTNRLVSPNFKYVELFYL